MKGELESREKLAVGTAKLEAQEGKVLQGSCVASKMQVMVEFESTKEKVTVARCQMPSVAQAEGEGEAILSIDEETGRRTCSSSSRRTLEVPIWEHQ